MRSILNLSLEEDSMNVICYLSFYVSVLEARQVFLFSLCLSAMSLLAIVFAFLAGYILGRKQEYIV